MTVSGAGAVSASVQTSPIMSVLKSSQETQGEVALRLLEGSVETQLQTNSMEQIGQVLDVYA